ncbi:MAG: choice-of-anchor B family protein, partial [Cytophagales bacterium]|nr:choice-of-anchor B family protein [Cytophagales bacterium]
NYHLEAPEFTKTFIWDVQDLDAPLFLGTFVHSTVSIDHNLYIVDDMVFQSNYTSGLRILDISDIANANLEQLAFFDTYPENDDPHFLGTWSNYPFFDSGVVPVSDFTRGLFLVMPRYDEFILGLNEANPLNDLKVYPIPARDWITIESSQLENYSIFAIHSLGGRVTATGELTPNNRIDVSQLKRGMYLLTIKSERMNPITRRILID